MVTSHQKKNALSSFPGMPKVTEITAFLILALIITPFSIFYEKYPHTFWWIVAVLIITHFIAAHSQREPSLVFFLILAFVVPIPTYLIYRSDYKNLLNSSIRIESQGLRTSGRIAQINMKNYNDFEIRPPLTIMFFLSELSSENMKTIQSSPVKNLTDEMAIDPDASTTFDLKYPFVMRETNHFIVSFAFNNNLPGGISYYGLYNSAERWYPIKGNLRNLDRNSTDEENKKEIKAFIKSKTDCITNWVGLKNEWCLENSEIRI